MVIQYFLDNLWRWKCGVKEESIKILPELEELKISDWDNLGVC